MVAAAAPDARYSVLRAVCAGARLEAVAGALQKYFSVWFYPDAEVLVLPPVCLP